ncbi:dynein regulatory complex protein 11-like isoform X2 [Stegostoma tigrinum]|uniref:dynein regulatory complex protein 11-like isoform X2 n=1 Tax=Stegostoma tigrinum TaxID=3053191 RepID=UPI00286FD377|nr:dynein regulatory complex protein 11-like isoform X2 [Stegostoma tigrinum]
MSHSTYNQLFQQAQNALNDILELESASSTLDITKDAAAFSRHQNNLYIKYIRIFRKLEVVHDQIAHPQKWKVVEMLLEGVMGRIIEVRREMVDKGLSEFHFMDDVIQDLKLTPSNVEIPIPKYFSRKAVKLREERRQFFVKLLQEEAVTKEKEVPQSTDEAVRIIQIAERARQGRLRARIMRDIWREEQREKNRKLLPPVTMQPAEAATLIQKTWKGYSQRKKTVRQRDEEFEFIGMVPSENANKPSAVNLMAKETAENRHLLQEQYRTEYEKAQPLIKQTVMDTEGPDMKETYREQIRHWFIECYNTSGKFPDYPTVEQGGSDIIFAEKTPDQLLAEILAEEEEKENQKGKKGNVKEVKKEKKGKSKPEPKPEGFSDFLPDITEGNKIYTDVWRDRDESANLLQKHDVELEKEDKRKEVEKEIRLQVDELMREELRNLRMAVERDFSEPPKAKTKPKKARGKEKGSKKKEKDFTANRSLNSLCDELIEQGLLKAAPQVPLASYLGDFSYLGSTLLHANINPMPSLYDIRQIITTYAILPLGSQPLHEKAPLVKSILLAGPRGVGKKMLVHSICTETCATLFDLTAKNIAGKYPGKSGLQMMLHMVFKLEPKRLKKNLPKLLKQIKAEDRVLLVGTSSRPFDAELKPLFKVYDRIILIPRADYASRYVIWKNFIEEHGGVISNTLDLTSLAKISDGYTPGHLVEVVKSVLTDHRIEQQAKVPLTANNFIRALSKIEPIYQQEETAFMNWASKTPLAKKALKAKREKEALEAAAQEAANKKKR